MRAYRLFLCGMLMSGGFQFPSVLAVELDRYWFLIHDRAVRAELKLTAAEQAAVRQELDELDSRFMALRGTSAEKMAAEFPEILAEARNRLHRVLRPEQERRLNEIVLRVLGPAALLRPDVAAQLKLTADQKKKLAGIIGETQEAIAELEKQAREGKPLEPLEKEARQLRTEEQLKVFKSLTRPQQTLWTKSGGQPFDVDRVGQMEFKPPELTGANVWINSEPLTLAQLKGKVVALHFYTFG